MPSRASSGPAIASSVRARSPADRVNGPITPRSPCPGTGGAGGKLYPREGIRPSDGLCPKTPQKCAGRRIEPPMSDPSESGPNPAATAAADPPDEPPGERLTSQGLLVVP